MNGSASAESRLAGLALMVGAVLMVIAGFFYPGVALIEQTDQTDFQAAMEVVGDYSNLAHITTLMGIVGVLGYALGFMALWRVARPDSGIGASLLRFGVGVSLLGWSIFAVGMGVRHLVVFLVSIADANEGYFETALSLQVAMSGIFLSAIMIYPFASFLTGIGLASRYKQMDLQKIAAIGLAVVGVASFLTVVITQHYPDPDFEIMTAANNIILAFGTLFLFIVGHGIYSGRKELTAAD